MAQIFLWNVIVINLAVGGQGFPEIVLRGESRLFNNFPCPVIKSLYHVVGLWMAWLYDAMIYIVYRAFLIKQMVTRKLSFPGSTESVGELLAIVHQDFAYDKGDFYSHVFQKSP